MKKRKIGALLFSLALLLCIGAGISLNIENISYANDPILGNKQKVIPDYTGRDPETEGPYSFVFSSSANTPQYQWYKQLASRIGVEEIRFYEELYRGQFLWYSKVPPYNAKEYDKDMMTLYENKLRTWGLGGSCNGLPCHIVDYNYSTNLKLGKSEPGKQTFETPGTTYMVAGPYEGRYLEWRTLGLTYTGNAVDNPYFPADYPSANGKWEPWLKNWIAEPWNYGWTEQTAFDRDDKKVQWFVDYFFAENPKFRRPSMSIQADAADWAKSFTVQTNPDKSTGILTGFHKVNGKLYYATLLMKTPPKSNLRVVEYSVYDKETGKLIGKQTLDPNVNIPKDGSALPEERFYYDENGKEAKKAYVEHGKTYVIKAKVKNMIVKDLDGKDTTYTPIRLNQNYAYDLKSQEYGSWNESYPNSVTTTKPEITIKYGKTVDFSKQIIGGTEKTWEYTVPPTVEKEIVFQAEIVEGFKKKNENTWAADDVGRLRFYIAEEDIATPDEALLINQDGVPVQDVVPHQTYSLRFYVDKVLGKKAVGDPNDNTNPFASVEVVVSDKKISKTITGVAKEVLTPQGKRVAIEIPNAITPQTSIIEATWQIAQKHRDNKQSTNPANDGPHKKTWASDINISVNNLDIKASSFMLPVGKSSTTETLTFNFDIMNENVENQAKDIDVVIKKDGRDIWSNSINVPANVIYTVPMVTVPGINLGEGENAFTVEVNPPPRKWLEFWSKANNANDVYKDNIATNSVMVHKNKPAQNCLVLNNQNTWQTTHYLREWHGYREEWYHYTEEEGGHWHSYCVTTSERSWTENISYYERYQITNVFFRSKLTKDQALRDGTGDGWVDIVNGKEGEVKAGYGFEIKYVVKYQTNTYSASPKPWYSDCSGKSVSPSHGSHVDAPDTLQITMPFNDQSGQPVRYSLAPSSETGSWDNLTQTFEMPVHKAFNLKNTREIFTNISAKDGDYPLRIDTYSYFYGSYDKPSTSKYLCDYKIVTISIKGSNKDDLKTHLTQ